jgi:hypothetical protein
MTAGEKKRMLGIVLKNPDLGKTGANSRGKPAARKTQKRWLHWSSGS